jgi:hypothetical protein
MQSLTFDQLHALPITVDLITAARALGIGRTKAYELARTEEFPCRIIRVGTGYHVPTAELLKVLGVTPPRSPEADTGQQPTTT